MMYGRGSFEPTDAPLCDRHPAPSRHRRLPRSQRCGPPSKYRRRTLDGVAPAKIKTIAFLLGIHLMGFVAGFAGSLAGTKSAHRRLLPTVSPRPFLLFEHQSKTSRSLLFMEPYSSVPSNDNVEWHVYVDQSKSSLEKGGSATLDAFVALVPSDGTVQVHAALLPKTSKVAAKGPAVRCIPTMTARGIGGGNVSLSPMDIANVDSVDKVYRVLTKHMNVKGVSARVCQCLQHKYRGNGYLEENKVSLAIEEYRRALEVGVDSQRGILLLQRANAYLRRANQHKDALKQIVQELVKTVPDPGTLRAVYEEASGQPLLALSLFRSVLEKTSAQKSQFRKTQYRHGLYQHALLKASQDALEATSLLPNYGTAFYRTGEILSELWKVKESLQYYDRAVVLDPSLAPKVRSVTDRLRRREELLESARAYGWTDNALRLALDVS